MLVARKPRCCVPKLKKKEEKSYCGFDLCTEFKKNQSQLSFSICKKNLRGRKNLVPCDNVAPNEIRFGSHAHLYYSKSSTYLKTYYYWESSTKSPNWPTHDPCGRNGLPHVKNVVYPHGNIFIRQVFPVGNVSHKVLEQYEYLTRIIQ